MDSMARTDGPPLACFECGATAIEDHHIIPESRGGTKTVPLCGRCHDLVHDRAGNRTDSATILIAEGWDGGVLIQIADPPQLVQDRVIGGMPYEDWRPWLRETLKADRDLREKVRGRR